MTGLGKKRTPHDRVAMDAPVRQADLCRIVNESQKTCDGKLRSLHDMIGSDATVCEDHRA